MLPTSPLMTAESKEKPPNGARQISWCKQRVARSRVTGVASLTMLNQMVFKGPEASVEDLKELGRVFRRFGGRK